MSLVVTPTRPVKAAVFVDGVQQFSGVLKKDVAQTFTGASLIRLRLERGGLADLVVNGKDIGKPGTPKAAYSAPFQPGTFRSPGPGG